MKMKIPSWAGTTPIGNEVVTITYKTPSYEDKYETKLQAKFAKSDKSFEQQQQ